MVVRFDIINISNGREWREPNGTVEKRCGLLYTLERFDSRFSKGEGLNDTSSPAGEACHISERNDDALFHISLTNDNIVDNDTCKKITFHINEGDEGTNMYTGLTFKGL